MVLRTANEEMTDEELVAALSRGDKASLAGLYDRYASLMLAVARKFLKGERDAEDLVHDVFLEMWKKADAYDASRGTVRTWILMRLRSRALDRCKSVGNARTSVIDPADVPSTSLSDEATLLATADRSRLISGLSMLSNEQRDVVELAYFEGLSASEISERIQVPIGTVKSRTASALQKLRQSLSGGRKDGV